MKKLADISTFNRVCGVVENTSADNMYADLLQIYENGYSINLPNGKRTPKDALTPNGKLLAGQQIGYNYWLQGKGSYSDYMTRLKEYKNASKVFKNLWASALKHNRCTPAMQDLRDMIADFDASISQFTRELQNNLIYKGNLQ